ncbi:hypothetical protein RGG47_000288 [Vibrio parahaemolyticus]|nr:hypothetical protein [Vibrio parahaemolyticus]
MSSRTIEDIKSIADIKSPKVIAGYEVVKALLLKGEKITENKVADIAKFSGANLSTAKNVEWQWLKKQIILLSEGIDPKIEAKLAQFKERAELWEKKFKAERQDNVDRICRTVEYQTRFNQVNKKLKDNITQYDQLSNQYNKLKKTYADLEDRIRTAQNEAPVVASFGRTVISPDTEMLKVTSGVYQWDKDTLNAAHSEANDRLEYELRNTIPTRLYITVGRPGSGKSLWVEQHKNLDTRRPIYFDATNANSFVRRELFRRSKKEHPDCICCLVYFLADIDTCVERNAQRPERGITENYVRQFEIEVPSLSEGFDEMIIVRD